MRNLIPTENFPLAMIVPSALVIPLPYLFYLIGMPGPVLMILGPPFALGFLTVLIFGAFDVPFSRVMVATLLSIVFYLISAFGVMILYGLLFLDAGFSGHAGLMFLSPYFIFWAFYTCVIAIAGAFAGGVIAITIRR